MLAMLCICIAILEFSAAVRIMRNVCKPYDLSLDQFFSRCGPESLYRVHCHGMMGGFTLQLATILATMGMPK